MSKKEETKKDTPVSSIWDRKRTTIDYSSQPSLTKSEFKEECDINNVVRRAIRTGILPGTNQEALYGDFSEVTDFASAQIKIAQASQEFDQLPSAIKEKFDNNVTTLLDWIDNPENADEARELGLLPKLPEQESKITNITEDLAESNQTEDSNIVDS